MIYHNYFWGMHTGWWLVWVILFFWIYATPYDIPGQRNKKTSPLDLLNKRLANGEISKEEYVETRKILEGNIK